MRNTNRGKYVIQKRWAINMHTLQLSSETDKGAIYPTSCVLQKMRRKRRFALLFSIVCGDELVFPPSSSSAEP